MYLEKAYWWLSYSSSPCCLLLLRQLSQLRMPGEWLAVVFVMFNSPCEKYPRSQSHFLIIILQRIRIGYNRSLWDVRHQKNSEDIQRRLVNSLNTISGFILRSSTIIPLGYLRSANFNFAVQCCISDTISDASCSIRGHGASTSSGS